MSPRPFSQISCPRISRVLPATLLTLCLVASPTWGKKTPAKEADTKKDDQVTVNLASWLQAGPEDLVLPYGDEDFGLNELLDDTVAELDEHRPSLGGTLAGHQWTKVRPSKEKGVTLEASAKQPRVMWLATWIEVDRFTKATLKVTSEQRLKVFVDGAEVAKAADVSEEAKTTDAELKLFTGTHAVVIQALAEAGTDLWRVDAELALDKDFAGKDFEGAVRTGASLDRALAQDDLLDVERRSQLSLSPDGGYLLTQVASKSVPSDKAERYKEISDAETGAVLRRLTGKESDIQWMPGTTNGSYVYSVSGEDGADLYSASMEDGNVKKIADDVKELNGFSILPDGSGLLLNINVPKKADERKVKRYRDLPDRWSGWRDETYLVQLDWDGSRQRLTAPMHGMSLDAVRPDSQAAVIRTMTYGLTERPFSKAELFELDLGTLETTSLGDFSWIGGVEYSPDGKSLLITGSPALFDGLGDDSGPEPIANEYDSQAYILPLDDLSAPRALTKDLDPAVSRAWWSRHDGMIYFDVQDRTYSALRRLDPADGSFTDIPLATDTVNGITLAENSSRLAYVGSSPNRPHAVFVQDGAGEARLLADPSADAFAGITYGKVEPWTFTASDGTEILGRVYYPRGFDAAKKYPLIVYYYGGTVPVERSFGGRYPKEVWAANGYVVYVPQPSGATGFGQEFSARHVNAWGKRTADEIIEGTQKFLDEHSFVDPERVGCTGASYGGFMTMYLQTRTDLFAAAISHAGISNLASYWGQGWWGYLYSAAASAESYPWNNPELYVGQSPLYAADKIQTPLLLLHGDADTNVPPVESHQMYTALKVLGKPVELIEIGGENHTILSYEPRKLWSKTILAWFDRYLKDQPEAWEELWGSDDEPKG